MKKDTNLRRNFMKFTFTGALAGAVYSLIPVKSFFASKPIVKTAKIAKVKINTSAIKRNSRGQM